MVLEQCLRYIMNPLTYIVKMIINTGENTPSVINTISTKEAVEAFTSSPCLLQDCLTFMGFIRNYNFYEYSLIYNTLTSKRKLL